MRFFDRLFSFWLSVLFLSLLFLPKINLISFGGKETAGIRFDDILLMLFCMVLFWAHFILQKKTIEIENWIFALTGFSLLSFFLNRVFVAAGILHVNASIFYCLRLFEYFLFFYIGAISAFFFRPSRVIKAFFLWNMGLMLLQKLGLIGQFTVAGYTPLVEDRVGGIASFPSEAGMLLNMVFCYLIYDEERAVQGRSFLSGRIRTFFEQSYIYWLFLICAALVIITGSRIAILALVVAFFFRIAKDLKQGRLGPWLIASVFVATGVFLFIFLIQNTDSVAGRSAGLLSFRNLELIGVVWDRIELTYDPIGNESVSFDAYDMSWWMRIHKWCYALKIYYLNPECYAQGVGPGFAMAALDGGFVRILTEYGLIGCFLFWKVFSPIYRQSTQLRWMVIAFLINMIFFDVYLAYKPMSLLFFVSGCTYSLAVLADSSRKDEWTQSYKLAKNVSFGK